MKIEVGDGNKVEESEENYRERLRKDLMEIGRRLDFGAVGSLIFLSKRGSMSLGSGL